MRRDAVLRAIDRAPLEPILTVAFALALAFALYAMPAPSLGVAARATTMLVGALAGGAAVWTLFDWIAHPHARPAVPSPHALVAMGRDRLRALLPVAKGAEIGAVAPTLRRADAHPDAPARRPIFAAADFGAPLDAASDPSWQEDAPPPIEAADDMVDELLLDHDALSAMALVTRLETGLARRGGGIPRADLGPALQDAVRKLRTRR